MADWEQPADRPRRERGERGERTRPQSVVPPNTRVLVVDDVAENRDLLVRRLTRLGCEKVTQAENGVEALAAIRGEQPDLVLLDIMMPEMNGYETLEALKAEGLLVNLPIIVISALTEIDSVVRCIELGAEDYISKPFNPTLLRARVVSCLEKKRLRDESRKALERAQQDLLAARAMQLTMVPRAVPAPTPALPLAMSALLRPALEVGGDLIDFFVLDGRRRAGVVLGDVSGKGAAAALFMARTYSLVRSIAGSTDDPAAVLAEVNDLLAANNELSMFVTLFLGLIDLDSGTVAYANAGHCPPYVLRADGRLERIGAIGGLALAMMEGVPYRGGALTLGPGDTLVVYSDGVTEAMNPEHVLFEDARLEASLGEGPLPPPALVERLVAAVDSHAAGAPQSDDIAVIAVNWAGG